MIVCALGGGGGVRGANPRPMQFLCIFTTFGVRNPPPPRVLAKLEHCSVQVEIHIKHSASHTIQSTGKMQDQGACLLLPGASRSVRPV